MDPKNNNADTCVGFNMPGNYQLRVGEALHPKELAPKAISMKGTLAAPFDFLVGRPTLAKKTESILLEINNHIGSLNLSIRENDPFTTHEILGSLSENEDLKSFFINTETRWTVKNFIKHLRMTKVHFADQSAVESLIKSLQTWTAKIETVIKDHNDNSGNSLSMLEKKVDAELLNRKFTLVIPIYKGYRQVKFDVEICTEPKAGAVDLYLISDELYKARYTERMVIMADELRKFDDYKFSKVVVG